MSAAEDSNVAESKEELNVGDSGSAFDFDPAPLVHVSDPFPEYSSS